MSDKKVTAADVECAVAIYFNPRVNLVVPNVSWGLGLRYEADILVCSKSGYITEVEIKVSRADLKRDASKKHQHSWHHVNRLFFAMPKAMEADADLVPEGAGILLVDGFFCSVSRRAKSRKAKPMPPDAITKLAMLGNLRVWPLKRALLTRESYAEAKQDITGLLAVTP